MRDYIIKRLLLIIPTLLGITFVTFLVTQLVPGGPIEQLMMSFQAQGGELGGGAATSVVTSDNRLTETDLQAMKEFYGFDKPIVIRFLIWLKNVAILDFGYSFRYTTPVLEIIAEKLPVSCYYGLLTTLLVYFICIPLGVLKAVKHRTAIDTASSVLIFAGYAIPGFALGFFLLWLFTSVWQIFPLGGFVSDNFETLSLGGKIWDVLYHSILPLASYMIGSFAVMTLLMKNSILEMISSDFVRTALAKGVSFRRAVLKHALRNSLIPLATSFGHFISIFLTGSFLIERTFDIDGMGLLGYMSIVERDYPVALGLLVIGSVLSLVGNLLSVLCVAAVDPRVRFR